MGDALIRVFHTRCMALLYIMFLVIVGGNVAIAIYASRRHPQPDESDQDDILDSGLTREKESKS